jgi:hypothetical protein
MVMTKKVGAAGEVESVERRRSLDRPQVSRHHLTSDRAASFALGCAAATSLLLVLALGDVVNIARSRGGIVASALIVVAVQLVMVATYDVVHRRETKGKDHR